MRRFLPTPLIGIITAIAYVFNTIFLSLILLTIALLLLIPIPAVRKKANIWIHHMPLVWNGWNCKVSDLFSHTQWDIRGGEELHMQDWYLVISNHRSWTDIAVLFRIFTHHIPSLKFFMKKQLLWQFPFASQTCWLMGFPFMTRYSKEFLKKHPELKGKDLEVTRKSCEKFKTMPTTVVNFIEGGRFSVIKQQRQNSPYRYLLKPKAAGIAFVLGAMGQYMRKVIDVTIIYPDMKISLWDFFCGKVDKIVVNIEVLEITPDLLGDYENDRVFRVHFQNWLNKRWLIKDNLIAKELGVEISDKVIEVSAKDISTS